MHTVPPQWGLLFKPQFAKQHIQKNLLLTATQGNGQKWPLCTGDRYRQAGYNMGSLRDLLKVGLPDFPRCKPRHLKFSSPPRGVGSI